MKNQECQPNSVSRTPTTIQSHNDDVPNAGRPSSTRDRAFGGYRPPFKRVSEKEKELAERERALAEREQKMQELLASVPASQLVSGENAPSSVSEKPHRPVKKNEKVRPKAPKDAAAPKAPEQDTKSDKSSNVGSNMPVPVVTTITLAPTGSNIPEVQVDMSVVNQKNNLTSKKPPAKKKPQAPGAKPNTEKQDKSVASSSLQQNDGKNSRPNHKSTKPTNVEKPQDSKNKKKPRENKGNARMRNDSPVRPPRRASPSPPHVPSKEAATRLFAALSEYSSETRTGHDAAFSSTSLTLDQGAELLLSRTATRALQVTKKEEEPPKKTDLRLKLHGVPSEDYRVLYREIKEMEVEFTQLAAQGAVSRRKVATHTSKMRESYANLIVLNPSYSLGKNVPHKLWMSFYKPIEALAKDSKEARKVALTEDWKARISLAIEEATVHLKDLTERVSAKHSLLDPSSSDAVAFCAAMSTLYICLGDLSRYNLLYVSGKDETLDWSVSQQLYEKAWAMKPGNGQAHNQLAVLALKQGNFSEAVYQYTRSVCAMDPFPARENLLALYEKNRLMCQSMTYEDFARVRMKHGEYALFEMHRIKLQGMLDTRISLEQFEPLMALTMDSLQTMMDLGKVTNELILKILVMGIYCCERGGDISKETEKLSTTSLNSCSFLYEVFGLVVRTAASRMEFLESASLFCLWLIAHPWLASVQDERRTFFLTGLAQLVNGVIHSPKFAISREADPGTLMIDGFRPICSLPSVMGAAVTTIPSSRTAAVPIAAAPPATSFDASALTSFLSGPAVAPVSGSPSSSPTLKPASLPASSNVFVNLQSMAFFISGIKAAGQLLVFHESTGRYSAFAEPKQAIQEEEKAELLARLAAHSAKVARAKQDKAGVGKKKKKSKSAKTNKRTTDKAAPTPDPDDPDSFAFVDEATESAESKATEAPPEAVEEDGDDDDESSGSEEEKTPELPKNFRPLIVLDAPNICMRHGNHKTFSTLGLQICIQFYRKHGFRVLAFLPEFYLDYKFVGDQIRKAKVFGQEESKTKTPDNVSLLLSLRDEGLLCTTPAQDYDDTYCIEYALKHQAYIVSNDKYRDYTEFFEPKERSQMRAWFRQHLITYTFVANEFLTVKDPLKVAQSPPEALPERRGSSSSSERLTTPSTLPESFAPVMIATRRDVIPQ